MLNSVRMCDKAIIRIDDIRNLKGVGKKFGEEIIGMLKENFNIDETVVCNTKSKMEKSERFKVKHVKKLHKDE